MMINVNDSPKKMTDLCNIKREKRRVKTPKLIFEILDF